MMFATQPVDDSMLSVALTRAEWRSVLEALEQASRVAARCASLVDRDSKTGRMFRAESSEMWSIAQIISAEIYDAEARSVDPDPRESAWELLGDRERTAIVEEDQGEWSAYVSEYEPEVAEERL